MSLVAALGIALAAAAGTVLLINLFPGKMRNYFFEPIKFLRIVFGVLVLTITVWYGLRSGTMLRIGVAVIMLSWTVSWFWFENPTSEVK